MSHYKGACLCGKVQFEIHTALKDIVFCHCSLCRKAQGSAFAANANVDISEFVFISGEQALSHYQHTEQQSKSFSNIAAHPS